MSNLFKSIPADIDGEVFEVLASSANVKVERIVSKGHTSPVKGWYDQESNEFVLLLKGAARLEFDDGRVEQLAPGDWLDIAAHRKHRVAWTEAGTETVWLAVHYN
ncbi:MAG: cupin domain-containing protein [Xanthomonadales bacterium]|jgi:cupin 2 domain-containing protein|nr:cupin domain-containing protein [Xanthomonadales bacterium]